jgi:ribonuclease BN (tRNA processing enzyme)
LILTVLGSGSIYPDPDRAGPAYLLTQDDSHLLMDVGPGAMRALARSGLDPTRLDGVCITHRHPDHTSELRLLLELGKTLSRERPLLLAGPEILDELVTFHLRWGRDTPKQLSYELERLVLPGKGHWGPFALEGTTVPHVDHSVGLRIESDGRTVVYPGDCGPGSRVVDLARDADLLVLECTLASGERSAAHLSPEDAAELAARSGCRRLVLSHFRPGADVDAALAICAKSGVAAEAAYDGAVFEI